MNKYLKSIIAVSRNNNNLTVFSGSECATVNVDVEIIFGYKPKPYAFNRLGSSDSIPVFFFFLGFLTTGSSTFCPAFFLLLLLESPVVSDFISSTSSS